jgi:diguanylate cyclase (GGDEF)-like protein
MNIEPTDNELKKIADENGLAIIVVDETAAVAKANNNSICEHLYASEEFAPRCAEFCGRAFEMAAKAGKPVPYRCHAGLDCLAVPLRSEKPLAAIVGRTFSKGENFEQATERAFKGDWQKFPQAAFFENVLISGSAKSLEKAARRVENLGSAVLEAVQKSRRVGKKNEPPVNGAAPRAETNGRSSNGDAPISEDAEDVAAWRSLFGSMFELGYHEACASIIRFLARRYALTSMAWLERRENRFESLLATGTLDGRQFRINLPANDRLLFDALEKELALDLRERGDGKEVPTVSLFPVAVGSEVQSALVVADNLREEMLKRRIARFCKTVAAPLEILRLREEVRRRSWLAEAVRKFNASIANLDADDFWAHLTRVSAELMQAERSSLLVFDEKNDSLTVKAAIGATAERITNKSERIGERVARIVLNNGRPVIVRDVGKIGLPAAPDDWKYKSSSFISYPFTIGSRRVGILNVTDKADGGVYGEAELELLNAIAPQVAILIDRADLKRKAGALEQLSVTDALTGLLNRRYLEERLAEEIKRSNRYGYPMSFMMIDVDHFKSYNDTFGHNPGDTVLKMVAKCFRETLRGADIAARYGGEEFSILLPQTTSSEAEIIAERVREHIAATEFPNRRITVSIGIASCCLDLNSMRELIVAADKALYEAKRKGRNMVQVYENISRIQTAETQDK